MRGGPHWPGWAATRIVLLTPWHRVTEPEAAMFGRCGITFASYASPGFRLDA
jgi:hypothetical protein